MEENLKKKLEILWFSPYGAFGAMRGFVEDVEFTAIQHPYNKVFRLSSIHFTKREIGELEDFVQIDATVEDIAKVLVKHYEYFHSEVKK